MAASAEDQARLLVSIEATQKRFEKQLAAVAKAAGGTATGIENRFQKANDNMAKGFDAGGRKVVRSLGAQRAAAQNLSFQLNDIATQLAAGTSPFTVMAQQGGQVAQIIGGAGGLRGALGALGGALGTLLNPAGLVSVALIGLTGYAVQYFAEVISGGEASEETLKKQADLIQRIADKYGEQIPVLKAYANELKLAADNAERLEGINLTKEGIAAKLEKEFRALTDAQVGAISVVPDANREYGVLAGKMASGAAEAEDFQRVIDALNIVLKSNSSPAIEAARDALIGMQAASGEAADKAKELDKAAGALFLTLDQGKDLAAQLTAQMAGLGPAGASAIAEVAGSITGSLIPAMTQAVSQLGDYMENLAKMQDVVRKTPLGQLSPLYSGGGQFLNEDQANTFRAGEANFEAVGASAAAQMIRGFESFAQKAYADTRTSTGKFDAWRVGFGSDTVTRANGDIEKVTKETVATLADAERDLSRRLMEFQSGIQKAIGIDTWNSLNAAQQAALSSIAYNYGSLPKAIVDAIESGGGAAVVAKAIAGLSANPDRRKQEAQAYLSGSGYSMSDAGLGKSSKKSPEDLFSGEVAQVEKRIALMNAEYAAQSQLNPLVNDYGFALEKARIEQQLLSEAQAAGLTMTPELAASIGQLAENYARASAATDQLKASQQKAAESAREFAALGKDLIGGFVSDLRAGKSAAEALAGALDKVIDKLLDSALDSIFSGGLFGGGGGGGGKGGLLGGFLIPGILHKGGVAGSDGYGHGRAVSPSVFNGAKRYHKGGIAGLQPGEVPAILKRGEPVLPVGTKFGGGTSAVQVDVGVTVDDAGRLQAYVKNVSEQTVASASPRIVSAASQQVVPTMARFQSNKAGGDYRNG